MSMLWFWVAYFVVTIIGIMHTIFNIVVLKYSSMKEGPGMGEGYEKTKPWHPLYNIIFFSLFGWLYMHALPDPTLSEALTTSSTRSGTAFDGQAALPCVLYVVQIQTGPP